MIVCHFKRMQQLQNINTTIVESDDNIISGAPNRLLLIDVNGANTIPNNNNMSYKIK